MARRLRNYRRNDSMRYARDLVRAVCRRAGQVTYFDDVRHEASAAGLIAAVAAHDTPVIFDWLMTTVSYQGIADAVAAGYMAKLGNATWAVIDGALASDPACCKLHGYWAFAGCHYHKAAQTCDVPADLPQCPVPRLPLRNGRLNQTAYSLFLLIRDVADGDIIGWIDRQTAQPIADGDFAAARAALIEPLRHVYGISDKVVAMALVTLLLGAGDRRPGWFDTGIGLVVVDTLVHNFLVRTGILARLGAMHPYGPTCYRPGGCADVITAIAATIDSRRFNPTFPRVFPRFVQGAIWRYCAQGHLDLCNGNQIDDSSRCGNGRCALYCRCDRQPLRSADK